ncbi:YbgC/FadM family acyl-CoA thioesterase [Acetobacteraceae bacterium ESL0709]|nr:YbgC/FadM family acyl-CoA thioesterase [Acetobacteraceae bacterium ESL0697]MDF7677593.1 YbgC/FadM family acyl-CoA thioesterase [Acetobacteraceae bacterium ESL0709]
MAHRISFRVYYEDTDAGGIVYHARYLGFAERARAEALRELGMAVGELAGKENLCFVVANLSISYKSPARLDDVLEVETRLVKMGNVRLILQQEIHTLEEGVRRLNAVLTVELATMTLTPFRPTALPQQYRERMEALKSEQAHSVL